MKTTCKQELRCFFLQVLLLNSSFSVGKLVFRHKTSIGKDEVPTPGSCKEQITKWFNDLNQLKQGKCEKSEECLDALDQLDAFVRYPAPGSPNINDGSFEKCNELNKKENRHRRKYCYLIQSNENVNCREEYHSVLFHENRTAFGQRAILSWSLWSNIEFLFKDSPGYIKCLDCLRSITFTWVVGQNVVGHLAFYDADLRVKSSEISIASSALSSLIPIYTYLFISGLTVSYTFIRAKPSIEVLKRPITWLVFYFHRWIRQDDKLVEIILAKPWNQLAPYMLGMIVGCFLAKHSGSRRIIHPVASSIIWIVVSVLGACALIFGNQGTTFVEKATANVLTRAVWSLCLIWIIVSTQMKWAGPIGHFLEHPFWRPFGKLSYCAFIVHHMALYFLFNMEEHAPRYVSFWHEYFHYTVPIVIYSYFVAFFLSLIVEVPMIRLDKMILDKCIPASKIEEKKDFDDDDNFQSNQMKGSEDYDQRAYKVTSNLKPYHEFKAKFGRILEEYDIEFHELSFAMLDHFEKKKQKQEEFERKMNLCKLLKKVISDHNPTWLFNVVPTGSSVTGLATEKSDLDVAIHIPQAALIVEAKCQGRKITEEERKIMWREMQLEILQIVRLVLENNTEIKPYIDWKEGVKLVQAQIQILRITTIDGIECDISVVLDLFLSSMHNSFLIKHFAEVDHRFGLLCAVVKEWGASTKVKNPKDGGFNSYALVLLVTHFLQCGTSPPILPNLQHLYKNENFFALSERIFPSRLDFGAPLPRPLPQQSVNPATVSQLFLEFLYYYADFDFHKYFISVNNAMIKNRKLTGESSVLSSKSKQVYIEDPFDSHNPGRTFNSFRDTLNMFDPDAPQNPDAPRVRFQFPTMDDILKMETDVEVNDEGEEGNGEEDVDN
ncbi:hypothetical protein L3Y34_008753 [Caenorhabditis briggsae]|uniref:Nose resistant-to-fluoxetine protein N-terminal domain-containing protein n=1 Tax=Caenorhabditis briggsae TaxID=6238 RepID=A0AAE9A6H5_CAEBR|nr:hypothetical protein L3Y34_008753 [Caenorhabditis briggsae]